MPRGRPKSDGLSQWIEHDLSAAAAAGELAPAVEVDERIDQVRDALAAGRVAILVGEPGVGKTAIIHELVRRSVAGKGPPELAGKRVVQLSIRKCRHALSRPFEQFGKEFLKLIEVLRDQAGRLVPFFSDLHELGWQIEGFQAFASAHPGAILAEGQSQDIATLFDDYPGLEQVSVRLNIEEPDPPRLARLLAAWCAHDVPAGVRRFDRGAIDEAITLTDRFLTRIRQPRKAIDLLRQVSDLCPEETRLTVDHVFHRFSSNLRVPRLLIDPAIPMDLAELEQVFRRQVLGQDEAVRAIVRIIGLIKSGLADRRRPFGVLLFVGPTGVGKTHLAQMLAQYLFGSRERLIRLNMTDFQDEQKALTIFGLPEADSPRLQRGVLTQRLLGHPFGVLLLDEFEKAHAVVHDRFMQLMDEGCIINGRGELVSCRAMIIIATSNAGAEIYRGGSFGFQVAEDRAELDRQIRRGLEKHFRFEFLNRFDEIVHFHPLRREDVRIIARRELEELGRREGFHQRGVKLEVDESVLDWLTVNGYDPDYGARLLRRTIEKHVTTAAAEALVRGAAGRGDRLELLVRHGQLAARLQRAAGPPATGPQRECVTLPHGTSQKARKLDRAALLREARAILAAAAPRLQSLRDKRTRLGPLLDQMNSPEFWQQSAQRDACLDAFRELDVAVRVEERLAEPFLRLEALLRESPSRSSMLPSLARTLEAAAASLRDWVDRTAEEGPTSVWMSIANGDALHPAGSWIDDLVRLERLWCARLRLESSIVAYEPDGDRPARVLLSVEGPGAGAYLAMESGLHRLTRVDGPDLRARVEVIPKGRAPRESWPDLHPFQPRRGLLGLELRARSVIRLPRRGMAVELFGEVPDLLSHASHDLARAWDAPDAAAADVARLYGDERGGVRDPRTDAHASRLRDVLRGNLDVFLESWRRAAPAGGGQTRV